MSEETNLSAGAGEAAGAGEGQSGAEGQGVGEGAAGDGANLSQGAGESWLDAVPEAHREALKGYESWDAMLEALNKPGPVVPDEYVAPEGIAVDPEAFKGFQPLAKELGLTQEAVDKLLKFDVERMGKMPEQLMARHVEMNRDAQVRMAEELGKEKYDAMVNQAHLAMRTFADQDIVDWLKNSGHDNSPVLLKFFAKVGAQLVEDVPKGGGAGGGEIDAAKIMFPTMK